jgi:hypothetical protein
MDVLDRELPLFVVCRAFSKQRDETNVAIGMVGPLTVASPGTPRAVALFTNRAGAERTRDALAPTHGVHELSAAMDVAAFLWVAERDAPAVVFDPGNPIGPRESIEIGRAISHFETRARSETPPASGLTR